MIPGISPIYLFKSITSNCCYYEEYPLGNAVWTFLEPILVCKVITPWGKKFHMFSILKCSYMHLPNFSLQPSWETLHKPSSRGLLNVFIYFGAFDEYDVPWWISGMTEHASWALSNSCSLPLPSLPQPSSAVIICIAQCVVWWSLCCIGRNP